MDHAFDLMWSFMYDVVLSDTEFDQINDSDP